MMLADFAKPCAAGLLRDFHSAKQTSRHEQRESAAAFLSIKKASAEHSSTLGKKICTNFRHPLVDAPHSPENKRLTSRDFPLTKKPEARKNILVL
jgi:hypothetical protein